MSIATRSGSVTAIELLRPRLNESTNRYWGYVALVSLPVAGRPMNVAMLYKRGHRWLRSTLGPSVLGRGLLVRARSTSLALLGLTTAVGLGMVALALNQGWPLIAGSSIPALPGVTHQERQQARVGTAPPAGDLARADRRARSLAASVQAGSRHTPIDPRGGSLRHAGVAVSTPTGESEGGSTGTESPAPQGPAPESPVAASPPASAQPDPTPSSTPAPPSEATAQPVATPSSPAEVTTTTASAPSSTAGVPAPVESHGYGHGHGHGHWGGKGVTTDPGQVGSPSPAPVPAPAPSPPPVEAPVEEGAEGESGSPSTEWGDTGHSHGHGYGRLHHY